MPNEESEEIEYNQEEQEAIQTAIDAANIRIQEITAQLEILNNNIENI
jgi:hypothetical protein